ncbi:MAG: FtsH protease activity modulator HflK [Gammaproteobacteria bacterium]|nr:MAG: FtsH protease activity modulator HflK [Gammaproteobacteria bacterium]
MPWNKPDDKDPWSHSPKNDGPPELDKLISQYWRKLTGGGKPGAGRGNKGLGPWPFIIVAIVIWALNGIYTVKEQERAVILRFGAFDRIEMPGLHWLPPGIDRKILVDVTSIRSHQIHGEMLTKGENIVLVDVGVQYRVEDPEAYIFSLTDPDLTVKSATEAALRQVIGDSSLDDILAAGKAEIRRRVEEELRQILEAYKAGVRVTQVTLGDARPPHEVKAAFDDAIKAREDKERYKNEAEAYANKVVPAAEGEAKRLVEEARGYKERVVAEAKGQVATFNKLLPEYRMAPEVTKRRLYLETMERILANNPKIIIDKESGTLNVLPLDQWLRGQRQQQEAKQ